MAKNNKSFERPVSFYIQEIQNGNIRASSLSPEIIEQIVEVLYAEGSSTTQIAQLLDRTDRTVRRYLEEIRKKNALTPNLEQAKQFVGELVQKARISHAYLMRLARSKDGSIAERTQAEFAAWRIIKEMIEKLQSLTYLPMKSQTITGDIYHHNEGGDNRTYEQLKQDLKDIERVARETGTLDPKTEESIKLLQKRIEKAEIVEEIADLNKGKDGDQNNKEEDHEQ